MFHSARIKLTAWYLLMIMFISISFSAVIYRALTNELDRLPDFQRARIERRFAAGEYQEFRLRFPVRPEIEPDLINEIKKRLAFFFIAVNTGILVISGGTGYFLAGKTLDPIKKMVDEQNRFVSDASHELRTPLTAMKSSLEVGMRDKNLNLKDAKQLITESIKDVDSLKILSDELLQMASYQKPNSNLKFEKVSLLQVIEESIRKVQPLADKKKVKISKNKIGAEINIKGNKYGLIDLFVILLDNAIKYSNEKANVEVKVVKTDGKIKIDIKDYGIGISGKDLPHVFDRFYRSDTSRLKENIDGYGLGLSIAKSIAGVHKGVIKVESIEGLGSTFSVYLPS